MYDPRLAQSGGHAGTHIAGHDAVGGAGSGGDPDGAPDGAVMDAATDADGGAGSGSAGTAAVSGAGAGAGGMATSGGTGVGGAGVGGAGAGGAGVGGAGAGGAGAGAAGAGGAGCGASDCCPEDPSKTAPGACGCGVPDSDSDADGLADCIDPAPHGWLRRLVFDHGQVGGPLTNFPLLVRITDAQLGGAAAASGSDIHFLAADQSTALDYEIEAFDPASGTLVAWVRVPSLDGASDLVLYLGYGDGQADRSKPSGVWSAHHYVWHLAQDPGASGTGTIKDSAARANGSVLGAMTSANSVAGVAGKGISFDGVDDCISFTNDVTGSGATTIQAWVKQSPQSSGLGSAVLGLGNQASNQARFLFSLDLGFGGQTKVGLYGTDRPGVSIATGTWTQLVWTLDSGSSRFYVNGALVDGPATLNGANTAGTAGRIGNSSFPSYNFFLLGQLDEVRVSTSALSIAWISTEYNNQKLSSTFLKTLDAPQPAL